MPKDFLQGASLKPTFIQHFKCGELHIFHIRFNIVKKHPPQNRTNVQIKGGGGQRPFEQCSKKLHFFERGASLILESGAYSGVMVVGQFGIISAAGNGGTDPWSGSPLGYYGSEVGGYTIPYHSPRVTHHT